MRALEQLLAVTSLFVRTIPQRLGSTLTAAVGVAGVVAVMVAVLSIAEGFRATLARTGSPDVALVMRGGSDSEMSSNLTQEDARVVADAPGVVTGEHGPLTSSEMYVIVDLPLRHTGTEANVPLRGVEPTAFDVRGNVRIVEGRRFQPGRNEIVAGVRAADTFSGLAVGETLRWGQNEWTVAGLFEADGSMTESEIWTDVRVLQPVYNRQSFQSVYARLESPEAFEGFKDALTADPRVNVTVERMDEYFASQSRVLEDVITLLGTLVVVLMGIGAVFGAINTMYSAVASRTREIATLRALGFGGGPVVAAVMAESLLVALAGGAAGGLGAYLAFNGYRAATLNWQSFSQVVFEFEVTPALLAQGLVVSLLLGTIGGLFPAIRAARVPVTTALRQL